MLHIRHLWNELPRQLPQLRAGETIFPIFQVLVADVFIVRCYTGDVGKYEDGIGDVTGRDPLAQSIFSIENVL
jgi:hypothetical protein